MKNNLFLKHDKMTTLLFLTNSCHINNLGIENIDS